jgi:hypothetical protein
MGYTWHFLYILLISWHNTVDRHKVCQINRRRIACRKVDAMRLKGILILIVFLGTVVGMCMAHPATGLLFGVLGLAQAIVEPEEPGIWIKIGAFFGPVTFCLGWSLGILGTTLLWMVLVCPAIHGLISVIAYNCDD